MYVGMEKTRGTNLNKIKLKSKFQEEENIFFKT